MTHPPDSPAPLNKDAEAVLLGRGEGWQPIRVKPLEWNPFEAETPFGYRYSIYEEGGMDRQCWAVNLVDGRFDSIQEARAAAQADFESRIMSALDHCEPPPTSQINASEANRT
jgi:hypothetical protein